MQSTYTAQTLLVEFQKESIFFQPTSDGHLLLDGEMSDEQLAVVMELKPEIINLINKEQIYRFGSNQSLFFSLDKSIQVFDISNKAANLFFYALLKYSEQIEIDGREMICFCQPSVEAYRSELRLCNALQSHSGESLQVAFDNFINTHKFGKPLGNWVQDIPVWQVKIYHHEKEIDSAVCNAIQTVIFCGYHLVRNPETTYKIENI